MTFLAFSNKAAPLQRKHATAGPKTRHPALMPLVAPIIPQVLHVADGDVVGEASQVPQCLATHVQQVNEVLRRREHQHHQRSSQAPI